MKSPFLIGLLSIIPGLGFFVLRKPRRGFWVLGILFVLLVMFLFVPGDFIAQVSFQLAILVWVGQIYLAAQSAKLLKRQQSGEITKPRETTTIAPPPSDLSLKERGAYKMREIVRQQLNPGENLHEAIFAQSGGGVGTYAVHGALSALKMSQYYVGLTDDSLILIEQDNFGKHADIKRIQLTDIKSSKLKKRILTDDLMLDFGDKNILKLKVTSGLRNQTQAIYEKLQSYFAG